MASLFVYGTLRLGDVRLRFLEPFVVGEGDPDTAFGTLFDTGAGYPAADFGGSNLIVGHRYRLRSESETDALQVLDEVESAVTGLYHRVEITTAAGVASWAYQYGLALDDPELSLKQIESGDWFERG